MTVNVLQRVKNKSWLAFSFERGFYFSSDKGEIIRLYNKEERKALFEFLPNKIKGQLKVETMSIQSFPIRKCNVKRYFRKECYSVDEVLPFIGEYDKLYDGDPIHMGSDRYLNFATHGLTCVECGLTGIYFAKETDDMYSKVPRFHFNLYAINADGHEIMMTKDHILPRSRGGADSNENYQPMCTNCNRRKGNKLPEEMKSIV